MFTLYRIAFKVFRYSFLQTIPMFFLEFLGYIYFELSRLLSLNAILLTMVGLFENQVSGWLNISYFLLRPSSTCATKHLYIIVWEKGDCEKEKVKPSLGLIRLIIFEQLHSCS